MLPIVARPKSDEGSPAKENRSSRGDRSAPSMVIAAFARARVLGLKILTIDAHIVLAPADAGSDAPSTAAQMKAVTPLVYRPAPRAGQRTDLAYAVRLLEEGSKSLDEVRAMRSLDAASSE